MAAFITKIPDRSACSGRSKPLEKEQEQNCCF